MSIDYEALLESSRVPDGADITQVQEIATIAPQLPTEDNPLEVYRLPDADTLPIRGRILQWVTADGTTWLTQATCFVILDSDIVEHFKSHVFILRRDADVEQESYGLDTKKSWSIPMPEDRDARVASATRARDSMTASERSPQDMFRELAEIRGDAAMRYKRYQDEQATLAKQRAYDAECDEIYAKWLHGQERARKSTANES